MRQSRRVRRIERHHQLTHAPDLNLVSMIDIFTILVFFLLISAVVPQNLPKKLLLPSVVSTAARSETLVLAVTQDSVLLQGATLGSWHDWAQNGPMLLQNLATELNRNGEQSALPEKGRAITLMADENVPYEIIEKIIDQCLAQDYRQIALAAHTKTRTQGTD